MHNYILLFLLLRIATAWPTLPRSSCVKCLGSGLSYCHQYEEEHIISFMFQKQALYSHSSVQNLLPMDNENGNEDGISVEEDDRNEDLDEILASASDDEVLLACVAYLQRHNLFKETEVLHENDRDVITSSNATKIGWNGKAERREKQIDTSSSSGGGYFWDRPDELKYLRKNSINLSEEEETEFLQDVDQMMKDAEEESSNSNNQSSDYADDVSSNSALSSGYGYGFQSYPSGPSEEHLNRSRATKKLWQDKSFRKKWYAARWPNHKDKDYKTLVRSKKLQDRIDQLNPEVFDRPEFQSLTSSEIASAVKTYISSNKKRSLSHMLISEITNSIGVRAKSDIAISF